tara:strand:+ start:141 stop:515 length:375 start_codon:yes stop_codon:yes gene_type:complete
MPVTLILNSNVNRERARIWCTKALDGVVVTFKNIKRTDDQNYKMWAMLTDVARGATLDDRKLNPDQWKIIFMSDLGHKQDVVKGLNGEWVDIGFKSSKLDKEQMSDLITSIEAYCAEQRIFLKK